MPKWISSVTMNSDVVDSAAIIQTWLVDVSTGTNTQYLPIGSSSFEFASGTTPLKGQWDGEKAELIDALYDAIPECFKADGEQDISQKVTLVAAYNDGAENPQVILDWFEKALVGVRTTA